MNKEGNKKKALDQRVLDLAQISQNLIKGTSQKIKHKVAEVVSDKVEKKTESGT
jgi:hypothetical protein